jgi:transcriptional regulator of heat shock response
LYNVLSKHERRLSVDWNRIKAEYIAGGTSYRKLAKKYGVPFSNLKNIAIKEQWTQLREQAKNRTTTKLVENISKQNAKIDDKYFKLVDQLLDKAEEIIANTPEWQAYSLKEMATALKYLKECKGVKTDADMREQEARIRNLEKQAESEQKDTGVTVIISDGAEDYSV